MFSYVTSLLQNPINTLIFFLLAFPGRLLAISAHEYAHAWMADRCGDPTARMLGRLTMNPLKHLDPIGVIMMLVFGFGWARPVPVNPRNYRNYRRDDLKVSLAGVVMNLIMFLLGYIILTIAVLIAINATGAKELRYLAPYAIYLEPEIIDATLGWVPARLFEMLGYFVQTNICLAIFNLIPVPPLDGYHVLNDLLLKRSPFVSQKIARNATGILFVLMFTGILGDGLSYAVNAAFRGMVWIMSKVLLLAGII